MSAPQRSTTPTPLLSVVVETQSTPPPPPPPKTYGGGGPRVITTSPDVLRLQTLFRSACHDPYDRDSPRRAPGVSPRDGALGPASPRSPRSPGRRSPRRRRRDGCASPLFSRPSPRRSFPSTPSPRPDATAASPRREAAR